MRFIVTRLVVLLLGMATTLVYAAEPINERRALFNYQILCQGCHVGDGRGGKDVPNMKGLVGQFLKISKGREYLVRVPGSANSALNSRELAELLNWMIPFFGKDSAPKEFKPYTEQEVQILRENPLMEVVEYRAKLMKEILLLEP
jgi:hypothetical protein